MSEATATEYAREVAYWDEVVAEDPCSETYRARWDARIRHPSWEERRTWFLWYTNGCCEHCGNRPRPEERQLELHHRHYDTLWYERNADLLLLCPRCHADADKARPRRRPLGLNQRIAAYMEAANSWSGQKDWPVNWNTARTKILRDDEIEW